MYIEVQIRVRPEEAADEELLRQSAAKSAGIGISRVKKVEVLKRGIDARQRVVVFNMTLGVHVDEIQMRKKVSVGGKNYIKTEWGVGYRFNPCGVKIKR